jgi:hypothetical protein
MLELTKEQLEFLYNKRKANAIGYHAFVGQVLNNAHHLGEQWQHILQLNINAAMDIEAALEKHYEENHRPVMVKQKEIPEL